MGWSYLRATASCLPPHKVALQGCWPAGLGWRARVAPQDPCARQWAVLGGWRPGWATCRTHIPRATRRVGVQQPLRVGTAPALTALPGRPGLQAGPNGRGPAASGWGRGANGGGVAKHETSGGSSQAPPLVPATHCFLASGPTVRSHVGNMRVRVVVRGSPDTASPPASSAPQHAVHSCRVLPIPSGEGVYCPVALPVT